MLLQKIKSHKTIVKNAGYLSAIELMRLIMPFVALPYIISTIGAENYGSVIFAQTVISYFIIFINFGLDISAVKDVSIHRENKVELNKIVSSVLLIKLLLFCIALLTLLILMAIIPYIKDNWLLYCFSFLTCFSEILFPIWFYQGIEKMKYLTLMRFASILFYTITVFIFIKSPDDYRNVVLLQSLGNIFAGGISFYVLLRIEKIHFVLPHFTTVKRCFLDSIPFFVSRLSAVMNNGMAKILSGIFFSMQAVAAFDLAQKIATAALIPMQMMNQAVYPHIAKTQNRLFASKYFRVDVSLSLIVSVVVFLLAPFAVHLFAGNLMPDSIILTRILCLFIFFGGITTYIGAPVLVSFGYPTPFNRSVFLSTISLIVMYALLYFTGYFNLYLFALILVLSEFIILIYRLYFCFKYKIFKYNQL